MKIDEKELRNLLAEAFEAGFYGSRDLQENVIEELVDKAMQASMFPPPSFKDVTVSGPYISSDGSAVFTPNHPMVGTWNVAAIASPPPNPADRRTWPAPNRNGDVFITNPDPQNPDPQNLALGLGHVPSEMIYISVNPDPMVSEQIAQQMQ